VSLRAIALLLVATAALVAGTGLALGPVSAFCASPVAVWLVIRAVAVRERVTADDSRRLVGAGVATAILGLAFALAGAVLAGVAVVAAGGAVVAAATQSAFRFDPPPQGTGAPETSQAALTAAVALDEGVKLWWELARLCRRGGDAQQIAAEVRAAADRNHERGWIDHPGRSHLRPPPLEKPEIRGQLLRGLGRVERLTFASEFEPQDPEIREAYLDVRNNRTAHAVLWRHEGRLRPTLICVHGYEMGRIAIDARLWNVDELHRTLGLDVAAVILPLHGPRSPGRRSGAGFLDGHPLFGSAAVAQAVWDLRRIWGWLRAEGAAEIGTLGFGLGGYITAVLASVEDGLACAVPALPVVSLENLVWRQMPPLRRAQVRAAGLTEHLLRTAWARHSPLRMRPRVSHEARLIVGGLADRVVPPAEVEALWEHWGRPSVHWAPGSHFAWIGNRAVRARLASHLRANLGGA
jgi:hypothetical protein